MGRQQVLIARAAASSTMRRWRQALRERRIAAAGLDVYEDEPHVHAALLTLPNVVLLPHIGSATDATRRAMVGRAADNLIAALTGGVPPTPINAQVLPLRL